MLRAYGAEVVITPTAVEPDSPESYYSVSDRLAEEIPGGFKPDQYSNMANPRGALPRRPGPEIWEQTGGELDAIVISVGTGGTISGVGRYFKEQKPGRADRRRRPRGLGLHGRGRARRAPVPRRGDRQGHLAEDDGSVRRRRVGPRLRPRLVPRPRAGSRARKACSSAAPAARPSGRRSRSRSAFGADATILTMIPDSGRSYHVEVLRRQLDARARVRRAAGAAADGRGAAALEAARGARRARRSSRSRRTRRSARRSTSCSATRSRSCPVVRDGDVDSLADVIGSLQDRDLLDRVFKNPDALHEDVAAAMQPPLAAVDARPDARRGLRDAHRPDERRRRRARGQAGRRPHALGPARVPRAPARRIRPARRGRVATEPLQVAARAAFPDATELQVEDRTGGGDHFQVTVASPRFDGPAAARAAPARERGAGRAAPRRHHPRAPNQDERDRHDRAARAHQGRHRDGAGRSVHEGHAAVRDVRQLRSRAARAAGGRRAGDRGRRPPRPGDPPGASARSPAGRRSRRSSSRAS